MPKISMKELKKFMKDNPNAPATQTIREQLEEASAPAGPAQIRNTASDLAAERINGLHSEILDGFKGICIKAIAIGKLLVGQKNALKHGEWLDWVETQLEIGPKQVQNYARIYHQREVVLESMDELAKNGVKPSIRKMLAAATKKDNQTAEEYSKTRKKNDPPLTPTEKRERRKDEKRDAEISTLAKMYMAKEIDKHGLRALVLRWNKDNSDNYELFVEDVKKEAKRIGGKGHPGMFNNSPSGKTDIILSIDADLWEGFVEFGGGEVFLAEYVTEYLTNYVVEQRSYRIAN